MTTATIVKLKAPAAKPARSRATSRKLRRQAAAAAGVGGVACVLTALSLNHLARGIGMVTGAAEWEAWSMAAGIDLGFVSLELAQSGGLDMCCPRHPGRSWGQAVGDDAGARITADPTKTPVAISLDRPPRSATGARGPSLPRSWGNCPRQSEA
jgi:hypothetical protein